MSSNSWTNMCTHTFTRTCTGQKEPFPPMLEQARGPKRQQKKEDMSEITAPSISASSSTKPFTRSSLQAIPSCLLCYKALAIPHLTPSWSCTSKAKTFPRELGVCLVFGNGDLYGGHGTLKPTLLKLPSPLHCHLVYCEVVMEGLALDVLSTGAPIWVFLLIAHSGYCHHVEDILLQTCRSPINA